MAHRTQEIAITFDDGTIGVMHFVMDPNLDPEAVCEGYCPIKRQREATDKAIQAEIDKSTFSPLKAVSWRRIQPSDIPADRTFRNAWRDRGHCIDHCMDTCKKIHKGRLRAQRAPLLAALDVEYQRADETQDTKAKKLCVQRKQALRDITADPRIESASTPEELLQVKVQ
jgi:hypothetical protein